MIKIALLTVGTIVLSSCSSFPWSEESNSPQANVNGEIVNDFTRSRLIARDLVNALVQLPELAPKSTKLFTAKPGSRFAELLLSELLDSGYDLRIGSKASNPWLDYTISSDSAGVAGIYTFVLSAGSIKIKRSYDVDDRGVQPASSLFVHGADASAIVLNDALFERANLVNILDTAPLERSSTISDSAATPAASSPPINKKADAPVELAQPIAITPLLDASGLLKENMYVTGRSNYENLLTDYETVHKQILVFPNDSLAMGAVNKQLAMNLLSNFNVETDVISVIGCSHGRTAIQNGNETLAIGRSYRVKEELMLAGIDSDKVLEEGCWAGVYYDEVMPRRGVVVTIKRRPEW